MSRTSIHRPYPRAGWLVGCVIALGLSTTVRPSLHATVSALADRPDAGLPALATRDVSAVATSRATPSPTVAPVVAAPRDSRRWGRRLARFAAEAREALAPDDRSGPGSGMAVAGLVCGIVSLFVAGIILGALAIVFGAISLSRANKGLHGRRKMAIAALVLGIVGVALAIIVVGAAVASLV